MDCIDHGGKSSHKMGYKNTVWNGKQCRAHRRAYCVANGLTLDDIQGLVIRHTCDNGRCVNPAHLITGTAEDNRHDMIERGRQVNGAAHGSAVLSAEDVATIRREYVRRSKTHGGPALARRFGVHCTHILRIVRGDKWNGD